MSDPRQQTGERVAAEHGSAATGPESGGVGAPPGGSAPEPRSGRWNGARSRTSPVPAADASRVEREIARHAWLSGVPLDPEERASGAIERRS